MSVYFTLIKPYMPVVINFTLFFKTGDALFVFAILF